MPRHHHLPSAAPHATRNASRWAATLLLSLFLGTALAKSDVDVPYIGEPADRSLSPLEEAQLGREVMRQLLSGGYVLEDPELTDYIRALGARLLRHTNDQHIPFHFFMVRDSAINAFALPGGYVGINAGLFTASDTESELAGVMAHEIAHVTQRHIARSMDQSSGWDIATTALVLAAIIAGANDPELAQAALSLGMSAAIQRQINFTRANELEADRLGIRTLSAAGLDPQGMASFFHRLSQKGQLYGEGLPEILRTHPVNTTRIAEARSRAQNLPAGNAVSSLDYRLMKQRARLLMTELDSDALTTSRALFQREPSVEHEYALVLALLRNRAFKDAAGHLDALEKRQPDQLNIMLSRARLLAMSGQAAAAEAQYRQTIKRHPRARPALLSLADHLIREGRPAAARQHLLESDLLLTEDSETYRLLAMAARDMNETAEAHFQMSGYAHSRGDYVTAIRQLRNGLALDKLAEHDRKRLQGRLNQYSSEAPESERERARQQDRRRASGHAWRSEQPPH